MFNKDSWQQTLRVIKFDENLKPILNEDIYEFKLDKDYYKELHRCGRALFIKIMCDELPEYGEIYKKKE